MAMFTRTGLIRASYRYTQQGLQHRYT